MTQAIDVIIPAFNEQESIPLVLNDIPKDLVRDIIVVNNASTDNTTDAAKKAGATVLDQPQKGYGNACLKGIEYLRTKTELPHIVVFLDADYSDHPEEMPNVTQPITEEGYDMVIGSRALGQKEQGAMLPQAVFGNWLATFLIKLLYNYEFTDLGPFRAIKWNKLMEINMVDQDFGWTVEMQVKAAKHRLPSKEVPVTYRKRVGVSKVTGTLRGTLMAGYKIIWTIFKYAMQKRKTATKAAFRAKESL